MTATLLAEPDPGPRGIRPERPRIRVIRPGGPTNASRPFEAPPPTAMPSAESMPLAATGIDGRDAAGRAALRYVRICIEVLNGYRPPGHLRGLGGAAEFGEAVGQLRLRRNGRGYYRIPAPGPAVPGPAVPDPASMRAGSLPAAPARRAAMPASPASRNQALAATVPPSPGPPTKPVSARPTNASAINTSAITGTADRRPRNDAHRPVPFELSRMHVSEPTPGVAEAVALLSHAGTTIAMAMRLERRGPAWTCTVVQVI